MVLSRTIKKTDMTRINLVPVEELCDQHLLAEHRELKRIPNCLLKGILKTDYPDRPSVFTLGKGHVKFFTNKLGWLWRRYNQLHAECLSRGFNISYQFRNAELEFHGFKLNDDAWAPTAADIAVSRDRIQLKMPPKPRHTKVTNAQAQ